MMLRLIAIALLLVSVRTAYAQTGPEYITTKTQVRIANPAKNPLSKLKECANQSICGAAMEAVATYYGGAPPGAASAVANAVGNYTSDGHGQEFHGNITLPVSPVAYKFCHVKVETMSANPESGDRDPYFSADAYHSGLAFYAWVDTPAAGNAGASLFLDITLVGLRTDLTKDYAKYGCQPEGNLPDAKQKVFHCRGGGSHGEPKCAVMTY